MTYDTATPYIASYVLAKKDGKVAFVLRSNTSWMNGYYSLAAGKVEKGESFAEAAIREAKEEIGITIQLEKLRQVMTCHRREINETMSWVDVFFETSEWEGEVINAEPHMHATVDWLDLQHLPENVIPSLRYVLKQLSSDKTYCEYGWGVEKTD